MNASLLISKLLIVVECLQNFNLLLCPPSQVIDFLWRGFRLLLFPGLLSRKLNFDLFRRSKLRLFLGLFGFLSWSLVLCIIIRRVLDDLCHNRVHQFRHLLSKLVLTLLVFVVLQ